MKYPSTHMVYAHNRKYSTQGADRLTGIKILIIRTDRLLKKVIIIWTVIKYNFTSKCEKKKPGLPQKCRRLAFSLD